MKKKSRCLRKWLSKGVLLIPLIAMYVTNTAFAYSSYDIAGFVAGKPAYTVTSNSTWNSWYKNKADGTLKTYNGSSVATSSTTIMSEIKASPSYTYRPGAIADATYIQRLLTVYNEYGNGSPDYTPQTATSHPNGAKGFTEWYDSYYGVFLDYVTHSATNTTRIKKSREFAQLHYADSTPTVFVAGGDSEKNNNADAKGAAVYMRRKGLSYPILFNSTSTTLTGETLNELTRRRVAGGAKNVVLLGGLSIFDELAGAKNGFSIVRCGGLRRNDTFRMLQNMPNAVYNPPQYTGTNGIVLQGFTGSYALTTSRKNELTALLNAELSKKDYSNLLSAFTKLKGYFPTMGKSECASSAPIVIGVNNGVYSCYCIIYSYNTAPNTANIILGERPNNTERGDYCYQFVLNGYYNTSVSRNSAVTSITGTNMYKESDSVYWTKDNSDVTVTTKGETNVAFNPEYIKLLHYSSSISSVVTNNPYSYINKATGATGVYNNYASHFTNLGLSGSVSHNSEGGYIYGTHKFRCLTKGGSYLLHTQVGFMGDGAMQSSGKYLKVDGVAPSVDVTGVTSLWSNKDINLSIKATDTQSRVKYSRLYKDSAKTQLIGSNSTISSIQYINYPITAEGKNTLYYTSSDNVNNIINDTVVANIDKTNPKILGGLSNGEVWYKKPTALNLTVTDSNGAIDVSGIDYIDITRSNKNGTATWTNPGRLGEIIHLQDGNALITSQRVLGGDFSVVILECENGKTNYTIVTEDKAGNVMSAPFSVGIDSHAPTIDGSSPTTDWVAGQLDCSFSLSDVFGSYDVSGLADVEITRTSESGSNTYKYLASNRGTTKSLVNNTNALISVTTDSLGKTGTINISEKENGTTSYTLKAYDVAGNISASKTFTVKIDKSAPTITGSTPTSSEWYATKNIVLNLGDTYSGIKYINVQRKNTSGTVSYSNSSRDGSTQTHKSDADAKITSKISTDGYTGEVTIDEYTNGKNEYMISTRDIAGNLNVKSFTINIDKDKPNLVKVESFVLSSPNKANEIDTNPPSEYGSRTVYKWQRTQVKTTAKFTDLFTCPDISGIKSLSIRRLDDKGNSKSYTNSMLSSVGITHNTGDFVLSSDISDDATSSGVYSTEINTEGIFVYDTTLIDNAGNIGTSGFVVRVDKTPPTGIADISYSDVSDEISFSLNNANDNLSGIDRIVGVIQDRNTPDKQEIDLMKLDADTYGKIVSLDSISFIDSGELTLSLVGYDVAGNSAVLGTKNIDTLSVKANITRVLTPHEPVFKCGEKGVINITVTGRADKVKITFPPELTALDSSLNDEVIVDKTTSVANIKYEFYIPLGTPPKNYNVQVRAYKGTKDKVVYPTFEVKGSILDNIRTRIKG